MLAPALVRDRDHGLEQPRHVDRLGVGAGELGVEARGVGDVGDQPVEAAHVVLDDREQAPARLVGAGERQRLDGAAQRGQRVLQLVRDVGGEALDRLDAVVERVGHVAQRAGEMPDLVAAVGEIGDLLARLDAAAHPLGGLGEAAHRPGDGAGEQHRQRRS